MNYVTLKDGTDVGITYRDGNVVLPDGLTDLQKQSALYAVEIAIEDFFGGSNNE